jgi:hypothetical protein
MNRPKIDPCQYVRDYYGVPARVGMHVTYCKAPGVITGGTSHVLVRLAGQRHSAVIHPTDPDLLYLNNDGSQAYPQA